MNETRESLFELRDLLVETARWSRVAERNGDLHARIASALARFESGLESSAAATAVGERQGRQPAQKSPPRAPGVSSSKGKAAAVSGKPTYVRCGKVIDDIRAIAREHGYAVAVHGSLRSERDIDLIAAPWVKRAHAPRTLMQAVNKLAYLSRVKEHDHDPPKPRGRLGFVWLIRFRAKDCPAYVDLSVMPRG